MRLADGRVVAAPCADVAARRHAYQRAFQRRLRPARFAVEGRAARLIEPSVDERIATLTDEVEGPRLTDPSFEARMTDFLRMKVEREGASERDTAPLASSSRRVLGRRRTKPRGDS